MWGREVNGLVLTFHLAGINNQNFLMRDAETGTYWQQISGRAISGPLAGQSLTLIPSDELTFSLWKAEQPSGMVLKDVPEFASRYAAKNWDVKMKKQPTVLNYAEHGLGARDLILGARVFGESRAWRFDQVIRERLVKDRVGPEPVLLVVGPDGQSVRAFRARLPATGSAEDFYREPGDGNPSGPVMIDSATGSHWNFQGCSIQGKAKGTCLERVEIIADYWFDWRHYNPNTTVYQGAERR